MSKESGPPKEALLEHADWKNAQAMLKDNGFDFDIGEKLTYRGAEWEAVGFGFMPIVPSNKAEVGSDKTKPYVELIKTWRPVFIQTGHNAIEALPVDPTKRPTRCFITLEILKTQHDLPTKGSPLDYTTPKN